VSRLLLDVQTWIDRGHAVVELAGELDCYSVPALREELAQITDRRQYRMAIVMSGVTFMDSSGLGALVGAANRARAGGGALALVDCGEHVLRVLRITGLTRVMEPLGSLEQAFAWLDRQCAPSAAG
jgi:anti-sigma B factor antagonist